MNNWGLQLLKQFLETVSSEERHVCNFDVEEPESYCKKRNELKCCLQATPHALSFSQTYINMDGCGLLKKYIPVQMTDTVK